MDNIVYHSPNSYIKTHSERELANLTKLSRITIRAILSGGKNLTFNSLSMLATIFNLKVLVMFFQKENINSEFSIIATAYKIERDGFESWKIHLMDFVDFFRKNPDLRLILLGPPDSFNPKLKALFAATVSYLCEEQEIGVPAWAGNRYFLSEPWFVSGIEALKASAILDSPTPFRGNNIFVLDNFLARV